MVRIDGLLCLLPLLFLACFEPTVACLDVEAVNFDVTADRDCCGRRNTECCCRYPGLQFSMKYVFRGENLSSAESYINDLGQSFRIRGMELLLSNVRIRDTTFHPVDDTLVLTYDGLTLTRIDDFVALSSSMFRYTVGTFKRYGLFDSISFTIGASGPILEVPEESFPEQHPLSGNSQNMLRDSVKGVLMYRIEIEDESSGGTPIVLTESASMPISVQLPIEVFKLPGDDLLVRLEVELAYWFNQIDFLLDSQETMREKIRQGLAHSFHVL